MRKKLAFLAIAAIAVFCGGIPSWANAGTIKTNITTWDAGTVTVGSQNETSVTITNTSSLTVTIDSFSISGSSEFAACCVALPKAIPPHGILTFGIMFSPTVTGAASATLTVTSTATNKPSISLGGTGFQHSVDLSWGASSSTSSPCWQNFTYQVYVSATNGGPYSLISGSDTPYLFYTDTNVVSGNTYYYVVTATADYVAGSSCPGSSQSGIVSGYSNQTTATIP